MTKVLILISLIFYGCNIAHEKKNSIAANDCAFLKELTEPSDSAMEIKIDEFKLSAYQENYDLIRNKINNNPKLYINFKFKIADSFFQG